MSTYQIKNMIDPYGQEVSLDLLFKCPLYTLTSIAHPERFYSLLHKADLSLQAGYECHDHAFFPLDDLEHDLKKWRLKYPTLCIICTWKDRIKLPKSWIEEQKVYTVSVSLSLLSDPLQLYSLFKTDSSS